nr:PREDICTED: DDB1- and CUL4-associated factor 15 [Anolis carolinensis]|eukprot:XP_016846273.1 PREDICTED: DDB1- and CUL4-associated factor 15 [Anolis carolinensis]
MAPSSKTERGGASSSGGKRGSAESGRGVGGRREHVVRQLERVKISGQLSPRLFRKLPPRVCVSLKSIVDEHFLCAGHIFLGFSKCGRYVLSYTSSSGDDDFSFYIYHLYWWEFNVHSKLKMVRQVRLFQDEEIYSDLYLTVCEWPSDSSKVIVFGFNTRSANGLLMNMMMSDENHRDIYISTVAMPPLTHCPNCRDMAIAHPGDPSAKCLQHGFMLHTKYQVVYPFPTFQPAFQLKKDQVVLLNTSYSLVACAVSVHTSDENNFYQILYDQSRQSWSPAGEGSHATPVSQTPVGSEKVSDKDSCPSRSGAALQPSSIAVPSQDIENHDSPAVAMAKEFVADIFRRAKEAKGTTPMEVESGSGLECLIDSGGPQGQGTFTYWDLGKTLGTCLHGGGTRSSTSSATDSLSDVGGSPKNSPSVHSELESQAAEPGYVNYTKLRYVLEPNDSSEAEEGEYDLKFVAKFVLYSDFWVFCFFADENNFYQILYDQSRQSWSPAGEGSHATPVSQTPVGSEKVSDKDSCPSRSGAALQPSSIAVPSQDIENHDSPAVAMAKEFVADIFRRAKEAKGTTPMEVESGSGLECLIDSGGPQGQGTFTYWDLGKTLGTCLHGGGTRSSTSSATDSLSDVGGSPKNSPSVHSELESQAAEPGYVNYTKLRYVLEPNDSSEAEEEYEDDKISLPFVVTDLRGRNLKLLKEKAVCQGQYLTVEQLTLDFEYVINEVIRNDASWSKQFCSFSDYDIVILEVCPETNQVIINIGLLLLAFPSPHEEGQLRPKTYHTSLKVAWDLNTGIFVTVSVGDLTEVKGQTSGSVWSSYRKSCVDMVMKWLVPESSGRYVNRMTNEALHKGCSLKFLADNERYTWIVL